MKNSIHILFSADDTYARMFLMAVRSMLNTTNATSKMHLHVIDRGIPEHWREMAECYTEDAGVHLTWINGIGDALRELPGVPITFHDLPGTGHYDRLLAPFIISGPKALYLDTDLLIQGDVSALWDESTNGCPIAAVQDQTILMLGSEQGGIDWEDRLLNPEDGYFNSGVLLMDLGMWRDRDLCNKCVECTAEFIERFGQPPPLHDQYALNVVCQGDWQALPRRWNTFAEKVCEKPEDASIVHFAGSNKPFYFSGSSRASGGSKYFIRAAKELMQDDFKQKEEVTKCAPGWVDESVVASFGGRFAIFVTAHPPYRDKVPTLLAEWDRQVCGCPVEKILAYDADDPPAVPPGWRVVSVKNPYGSPSPLRNLALSLDVDWIQFWDADNTPDKAHFRKLISVASTAKEEVGLIYPDNCRADGSPAQEIPRNGDLRLGYYVDTAACWRREAILSSGGWRDGIFTEDWRLACDIQVAGWKLQGSKIPFRWQNTPGNRSSISDMRENVWHTRRLGIITLLRGDNRLFKRWVKDLSRLELPPDAGLTVVADGNNEFLKRVGEAMCKESRFERKTIIMPRPPLYPVDDFMSIHSRVADLYNRAIRATPEEAILTWEDDIRPTPDALYQLSRELLLSDKLAAVAAPYLSRESDMKIAAARGSDFWIDELKQDEIPPGVIVEVGMVGGGFTLWNRAALEDCPLLGPLQIPDRGILGWDGFLCRRLNKSGWRFKIIGAAEVKHLTK